MRAITSLTDPALVTRLLNETSNEPLDVTAAADHTLVKVARRVLEASIHRPVLIRGRPFSPQLAERISAIDREDYFKSVGRRHTARQEVRAAERPVCVRCDKPYDYARPHHYGFMARGTRVHVEVWTCTGQSFYHKVSEPNPRARNGESDMRRARVLMKRVADQRQRRRDAAERKARREREQRTKMIAGIKRVRLTMKPLKPRVEDSESESESDRWDSERENSEEVNELFIERLRRQEGLQHEGSAADFGETLASPGVGDADEGAAAFASDEVGSDGVSDGDDSSDDDGEFDE